MPASLRLSWGMKTLKLLLLSVFESLESGWQAIRYALILVSAFFRQRASLGCEMVTITGTTVKETASSGGRLASETPCDAKTRGLAQCTVSGPATTLNDRPKSASPEVFRVA